MSAGLIKHTGQIDDSFVPLPSILSPFTYLRLDGLLTANLSGTVGGGGGGGGGALGAGVHGGGCMRLGWVCMGAVDV